MLYSLLLENFKAVKHLEIVFTPFTVLIGGNSCGKSTVLQALDFIRAFANRDIDEYLLHERGWLIDDLSSQFADCMISMGVELRLNINSQTQLVVWTFTITKDKTGKILTIEKIRNATKGETVLARGTEGLSTPNNIENIYLRSSYLKLLDENNPSAEIPEELYAVKKFFAKSSSYELLSPDRMREKSGRGEVRDIGMGGEQLAAYINMMSTSQKSKLNKIFSEFIGYPVKVTTEIKQSGQVDLFINENFSQTKTKIKAAHISDGFLRLLALIAASIPEKKYKLQKNQDEFGYIPYSGIILIDEIEDGIDLYLAEKVITMLRTVISDFDKQIIITTHSPIMLNHFEQNEIIFMWRDSKGQIYAKPLFATEEMLDTLECFNPGEVWLNYSKDEILSLMNLPQKEEQN